MAYCHDCKKKIWFSDDRIENGVLLVYGTGQEKLTVFKCKECFSKSQALTNYQQCEVYSRVVGYLRPVQQWNIGKKQEYREREMYKMPGPVR